MQTAISLISADDLARQLGYGGATSAFRQWCVSARITPVPGRRGYYDPALVRRRLDEIQGLTASAEDRAGGGLSLVDQRRARRGADRA
jgi:hypothetical protein